MYFHNNPKSKLRKHFFCYFCGWWPGGEKSQMHSCIEFKFMATALIHCVSCGTNSIYLFRQPWKECVQPYTYIHTHTNNTETQSRERTQSMASFMWTYSGTFGSVLFTGPQPALKCFYQILQFKHHLVMMHMQLWVLTCCLTQSYLLCLPRFPLSCCLKGCLFLVFSVSFVFVCISWTFWWAWHVAIMLEGFLLGLLSDLSCQLGSTSTFWNGGGSCR